MITTLELRAGERALRVRTELDNRCRDHRLRAHFPLPRSGPRLARRLRVRRRRAWAHRRGRPPRGSVAHVRVPTLRRRVGWRAGSGPGPRRAARVRGRRRRLRARAHSSARHRLPVAFGDAPAPEPGRAARPARRSAAAGSRRGGIRRRRPPGRLGRRRAPRPRRRDPRPARPRARRWTRRPVPHRPAAAGHGRGHLGGAPRTRRARRARPQPVGDRDHGRDRTGRRTRTGWLDRPPGTPARPVRGGVPSARRRHRHRPSRRLPTGRGVSWSRSDGATSRRRAPGWSSPARARVRGAPPAGGACRRRA